MENNDKSPHILNASSNLLGLCFIVFTSLRFLNLRAQTIIDELAAVATLLFMASCLFSFLSLRSKDNRRSARYERIADIVFLGGLFLLFGTTMLISLNLVH